MLRNAFLQPLYENTYILYIDSALLYNAQYMKLVLVQVHIHGCIRHKYLVILN